MEEEGGGSFLTIIDFIHAHASMEPKKAKQLMLAIRIIPIFLRALRLNWRFRKPWCLPISLTPPTEFVAQIKIIGGRNPPP